MNPWWRRPNPERGSGNKSDERSEDQSLSARESDGPAAIEDSLEPLPDIPEDDDDFEEEAPREKRKRSRRKRRRRGGSDKPDPKMVRSTATDQPISAALVDVEALADTLRSLSIDLDGDCAFAQTLACSGDGAINSAYANGNRHARLQRVLADAGFAIQETSGGTQGLRLRLAVDTVDLAHRAEPGALLLAGNHETMELLAERLAELERPLITAHDHLSRSAVADAPATSDRDATDRDDAADDSDYDEGGRRQEQRDAPRGRRSRGGRRQRSERRRPERSDDRSKERPRRSPVAAQNNGDAMALLDRALESLVDAGPQVIWATLVRQTMLRLDPEFDERQSGYDGFADLLEAAANDGIIRLQDDERTGSQVVVAWARPTG